MQGCEWMKTFSPAIFVLAIYGMDSFHDTDRIQHDDDFDIDGSTLFVMDDMREDKQFKQPL
jgi:hypothetical protein